MMARGLGGAGAMTVTRRSGLIWQLDLREGIDFAIFLLGAFEPATIRCYRSVIRPGDTVLDIGANVGAHTLPLAAAVGPTGRVIAFEATAEAIAKLKTNLSLNTELDGRVECCQAFLTERPEDSLPPALYASWPLRNDSGLDGGHLGRLRPTTGAVVATLDDLLQDFAVFAVRLVKLDVDGFECKVLRGAARLLSEYRPIFVMELSPYGLEHFGGSLPELLEIFAKSGYELRELNNRKRLPMDASRLRRMIPDGSGRNVIAWPKNLDLDQGRDDSERIARREA
jgi:FkbM family methyltransferase